MTAEKNIEETRAILKGIKKSDVKVTLANAIDRLDQVAKRSRALQQR